MKDTDILFSIALMILGIVLMYKSMKGNSCRQRPVSYTHLVTVMETGTGALSPDLYYSILHNKYKKSAAAKNKLSFIFYLSDLQIFNDPFQLITP